MNYKRITFMVGGEKHNHHVDLDDNGVNDADTAEFAKSHIEDYIRTTLFRADNPDFQITKITPIDESCTF